MKSLITALGLAFAFATVAPTIASLPFAASQAFAGKGHDSSADGGRHDGKADDSSHDGKADVSSHDGKSDVSSHDGKSDVSGLDGKDASGANDSQNGIDDTTDTGR